MNFHLPGPEYFPVHVSEAFYYRLPVRTIWKSYPIYHPDHEPPGYREQLAALEPVNWIDPRQNNAGANGAPDWNWAGLKKDDVTRPSLPREMAGRCVDCGVGLDDRDSEAKRCQGCTDRRAARLVAAQRERLRRLAEVDKEESA